jgi:hypothetical protein
MRAAVVTGPGRARRRSGDGVWQDRIVPMVAPNGGSRDPVRVGSSVEHVVSGLRGGSDRLGAVSARWTDLVGETVAAHAEPCRLRDGVLVVGVHQPGWATQLRYLSPEIVERCRGALGSEAVREIEIRVLPPSGRS